MIESSQDIDDMFEFAIETKRRLLARGLKRGHRKCYKCSCRVNARLAGSRNHLHMMCSNQECHVRVLE